MVLSSNPNDTVRDSQIKQAVSRYMDSREIPRWYRAFSKFQIKAVDNLMAAIRDDVEQETTHRVRNCLSVLGLVPLLNSRSLADLMKLSGGNDLAFLWFVMEFHYKTPGDEHYSLNEQLILSGIAHLDMITTLRGLDRILPKGHKSKRTLAKIQAQYVKAKKVSSIRLNVQREKFYPYFQKLERPKRKENTFLNSERPDFKVKFRSYEKYQDPNYTPPNEANRWFAMYRLRESKRISVVELRSYFDDFFKTLHLPSRASGAFKIIDQALDNVGTESSVKPAMCLKHKMELKEVNIKKQIRALIEKERCVKSLEFGRKEKQARLARIQEILEKEVNMVRKQLRDESKIGGKKLVQVLGNDTYSEHSIRAVDLCENEPECIKPSTISKPSLQQELQINEQITQGRKTPPPIPNATKTKGNKKGKKGKGAKGAKGAKADKAEKAEKPDKSSKGKKGKAKRARGGGGTSISFITQPTEDQPTEPEPSHRPRRHSHFDISNLIPKTRPSQLYFEAATANQPYKFNYEKIFHDEHYGDTEQLIKNKCVQVLSTKKDDVDKPTVFRPMPNVAEAAEKFANYKYDKELSKHRALYHGTRKQIGLESVEDIYAQQHMPDGTLSDMPRLEFYDCEDKALMHQMLEIGMKHLAKNRKYVLASLPDCHKLPDLREWIYRRYGKTYTQAERVADFELSQRLLTGLTNLKVSLKPPLPREVARKFTQTYACDKHIRNKVNRIRNKYFDKIKKKYMEFARLVWFSMNNSLCSISQRPMFFSYLPQRITDINLINPWKLHAVRNMKIYWEQKQLKRIRESKVKF